MRSSVKEWTLMRRDRLRRNIGGGGTVITEAIDTSEEDIMIDREVYKVKFFVVPTDAILHAIILSLCL
jgi:hypothetical protein